MQQRPRAAVLRFIEVRAENILRSFHTSLLRRDTAVNARSNPTAFTLSSSKKIVLQSASLGVRWRLTTDAQIENMLAGQPCTVSDAVRDIVNKQGRKYTEHLLSATMEAGFDLHAIPAVLLGGGASVVSRHLSPKDGLCKTIFLLDDKVNAVGFERALTAVSRRKSEA